MSILDVPRRTTPARLMAAAQSAGLHWAVRASLDKAGLLTTVVTRTGQGGTVTFRVPDPAPRGRQLVSMWIDRNQEPFRPGTFRPGNPEDPGIPAAAHHAGRRARLGGPGQRRAAPREAVTGDRGLPDPLRGRAAPGRGSADWA